MAKSFSIAGVALDKVKDLGAGSQGQATKVTLQDNPDTAAVAKSLDKTTKALARAQALVALSVPSISPFLAGPVLLEETPRKIRHLAPFAPGSPVGQGPPRTFAGNMEAAHHLACQLTALHEIGVIHGDLAEDHVLIDKRNAAHLIDHDNFASLDPAVPPPEMAGQPLMMAPEIRSGKSGPTVHSECFTLGTLMNMILLGDYPANGLATTPAERNQVMSSGKWPSRQRKRLSGETPLEALGDDIQSLFDQAFSIDPAARPAADAWRRTLLKGLNSLFIHECGQSFVAAQSQSKCPWCKNPIIFEELSTSLRISLDGSAARYKVNLQDGKPIILGRGNIAGLPGTVSSQHLEIMLKNQSVELRNLGRNGCKIWMGGVWMELTQISLTTAQLEKPLYLQLADTQVVLQLS